MAELSVVDGTPTEGWIKNAGIVLFLGMIGVGIAYVAYYLSVDLAPVQERSFLPFLLLGVALFIALGFEFVNGFHDTANAVATVIYTHSLPAQLAVVWSGTWNFLGVLTSSGAVAFGVISLLPVELILQVGSSAGFAMVFSLLIAAIIWNLGTWWLGLPASSSHTLIGSIIGVGLMNQFIGGPSGTSGIDWSQAEKIGYSLLLSPLIGFAASALLLLAMKAFVRVPELYKAPEGREPPPFWIRALLVLTCTGVSFAHGSNDGQKGMGLIMLILIGTVPTAFALNRAVNADETHKFAVFATQAADTLHARIPADAPASTDPRADLTRYLQTRESEPVTLPAVEALTRTIAGEVTQYGSLDAVPQQIVNNVRNEIYLADAALNQMQKSGSLALAGNDAQIIKDYRGELAHATKFIPPWVKVAVAIALGLGTMVGWKRIVVTVGEKIGKTHLTYGQGASAELVAMATIEAADQFGLPVSTTHVLSSGVAGTMAANGSGLQWSTIRNLVMAWVLTLPVSIALSGGLFYVFRMVM